MRFAERPFVCSGRVIASLVDEVAMNPQERVLRGRLGALAVHAKGATNTAPARAAFRSKFELEVDPDGSLEPAERARRAEFARRAHYTRLSFLAAKKRSRVTPR